MKNLLKLIRKYWAFIAFIISFVIDSRYGILEKLIGDPFYVNIIKGLGAALLAYVTNRGLTSTSKDAEIGGGGIKNPKP